MSEFLVVGYEGGGHRRHPLTWGAAAILDPEGALHNGVLNPNGNCGDPDGQAALAKHVKDGVVGALEVPAPVAKLGPYYVADLRIDLYFKKPYQCVRPSMLGIISTSIGTTRAYYVFESFERCESWLIHLNAGQYVLVPAQP